MLVVMSPDIVRKIVSEAGYEIVKSNLGQKPQGNLYYERDILVMIRPSGHSQQL